MPVWQSALAITLTRTSPALGGATVISSITSGFFASQATAACQRRRFASVQSRNQDEEEVRAEKSRHKRRIYETALLDDGGWPDRLQSFEPSEGTHLAGDRLAGGCHFRFLVNGVWGRGRKLKAVV